MIQMQTTMATDGQRTIVRTSSQCTLLTVIIICGYCQTIFFCFGSNSIEVKTTDRQTDGPTIAVQLNILLKYILKPFVVCFPRDNVMQHLTLTVRPITCLAMPSLPALPAWIFIGNIKTTTTPQMKKKIQRKSKFNWNTVKRCCIRFLCILVIIHRLSV